MKIIGRSQGRTTPSNDVRIKIAQMRRARPIFFKTGVHYKVLGMGTPDPNQEKKTQM
jgi:hypothetical protein